MSAKFNPDAILSESRVLSTGSDMRQRLDILAEQISQELAELNPVVIAVMNGGAFTAVELCRRFNFPFEFDYVHATRYGQNLVGGELSWRVPPTEGLAGRAVLVVDDILDHGHTLSALLKEFKRIGVKQLRTVVLVARQSSDSNRPSVDYCGLTIGPGYVFGCGMDYRGYWRGLHELRIIDDQLT